METAKRKKDEGKDGVYLTKRILVRLARTAFRKAAKESMERMGYIVVAEHGWIIKKFRDGRIERLHELHGADIPLQLD